MPIKNVMETYVPTIFKTSERLLSSLSLSLVVVRRLSAQVFDNNFSTSGRILKVVVLYEKYIHGQQMCQKYISWSQYTKAHEPVLHFANVLEINKKNLEPI